MSSKNATKSTREERLNSFPSDWEGPDAGLMADAFWRYLDPGTADNAASCDACGNVFWDWHENDDPLQEHRYSGPQCPFVQGMGMSTHDRQVASAIGSLLETGNFADVELRCGDSTFKAHKAIIGPASPVFAAALDGHFAEARDGVINVGAPSASQSSVSLLVKFTYTGQYDDASTHASKQGPWLSIADYRANINTRVYGLADYYQMPQLKTMALEKFKLAFSLVRNTRLPHIVGFVYQLSPPGSELCRIVVKGVEKRHRKFDEKTKLALLETEDFAHDSFLWR